VVLVMCGLGFSAAFAQDGEMDWERARERLSGFFDLIDEARLAIDMTAIDVGALGFELAFEDAETILEAVRGRLAFEPYRGVLRGAEGALTSGGGNSFDQSLLLATLLVDAGYDVQLVVTELDDDDAWRLLAGAGDAREYRAAVPPTVERFLFDLSDLASAPHAARQELDELLLSGPAIDDDAATLTDQLTTVLIDAVGEASFTETRDEAMAMLLGDVRRYAWVRYRVHADEAWTDAHPAWRASEPPDGLDVIEVIDGVVPEADVHRVRVEAFVERRFGDELEVHALMNAWDVPTALLGDRTISIGFVPLDGAALGEALEVPLDGDLLSFDLDPRLIDAEMFAVAIDGTPADGAIAFDSIGNVVPLVAALDQAAGVVRATGRGAAEATGALGGIGVGRSTPGTIDDVMALTGIWLDVSRIAPGGGVVSERRYLVDRVGPEQRADGRVSELRALDHHALLTSMTLSVHTGAASDLVLIERVVGRLHAVRPLMARLLESFATGHVADYAELSSLVDAAEDLVSGADLDHLLLADAMTRLPLPSDAIAYRSAPTVLVVERGYSTVDGVEGSVAFFGVDIHADPQRVLHVGADGRVTPDAIATARLGVWQTVTERAFVAEATGDIFASRLSSAVDGLMAAQGEVIVMRSMADRARLPASVGVDERHAMERDLERGFVVVVYDAPDDASTWWRVDTVTGETLGIGRGGRGLAEGGIVQALAAKKGLIVASLALYVTCLDVGTGIRQPGGSVTIPFRSCAIPLVGAVYGGAVTAQTVATYGLVYAISLLSDILGFRDVGAPPRSP